MNFSVCLLVIGELDNSGEISLNSLNAISGNRVCVAANAAGKIWLEKISIISVKSKFCFHDEIVNHFALLNLNEKKGYSPYRTNDFRKLTVLKWDLLMVSMLAHNESDGVLFSDLDILWLKDPKVELEKLLTSETTMAVQDDSSLTRPEWACTGVMAWRNTKQNLHELKALRGLHLQKILSGQYQDDEDTFNEYIHLNNNSLKFKRLSKQGFVVGRNFLKVILERNGFSRRNIICFHANYLTGLARKSESLQAVEDWALAHKIPWIEMTRFIFLPKYQKYIKRIRGMWP